jgi:hypothetical protein
MKKLFLLIGMVVLSAGSVLAQGSRSRVVTNGSANGNANAQAGSLAAGTEISGQLQNALDVKRAKPGDPVILKTTRDIKSNGQMVAKKGSRLVGHVTDVARRTKGQGTSSLGVVFDRLEGASGQIPLSATITSVLNTSARANSDNGMLDTGMDMGSSSGTMVSRQPSGGGSGGGLLGGVTGTVGGITNGATSTVGSVANTTTATTGSVVNATGQTVGSTSGALGSTVSGLRITPAVGGSVEGGSTLSAASENLRLEKGTTVNVRVN